MDNSSIINQPEDKNNNHEEIETPKKFANLTVEQWGWISVITNGLSVAFQMNQLLRTQKAQSFDMRFIFIMTLLNFIYFCMGILTQNRGLTLATLLFVLYNLTVVYFYYFGNK